MVEAAAMNERDLTRQVRDFLRVLGAWEVKHRAGLGDRRGVPDVLACYRGRFVALEIKAPKGRLTPQQTAELEAVRRAGGIAAEVRSLEDVLVALRGVDANVWDRIRL